METYEVMVYPVADDFEVPVFVLPGLGQIAQNFIEGVGEEVNS